jgi:hypothetical protein
MTTAMMNRGQFPRRGTASRQLSLSREARSSSRQLRSSSDLREFGACSGGVQRRRAACVSVARPTDASQRGDLRIVNGRKRAMIPAVASWKSKGTRQACSKLTSAGLRPIRSACVVGLGMSE